MVVHRERETEGLSVKECVSRCRSVMMSRVNDELKFDVVLRRLHGGCWWLEGGDWQSLL